MISYYTERKVTWLRITRTLGGCNNSQPNEAVECYYKEEKLEIFVWFFKALFLPCAIATNMGLLKLTALL